MITMKYKCTLLSDVILNTKSMSEGNNQTLDFIPGNCFLGIVAARLYHSDPGAKKVMDLFHNGKVRYGDAHPIAADPDHNERRTLKVPAVFYYEKTKKTSEQCYLSFLYDEKSGKQMKQCRDGFYAFEGENGYPAEVRKTFAIKSDYDPEQRRATDEKMFGYESLEEGQQFYFSVECDEEQYAGEISDALTGRKRLGRSRSAQYGMVHIEPMRNGYSETESSPCQGGEALVYADGRLIFFDTYGMPTFQPTAQDLGFEEGRIDWEKSQIRTFQYAPWNSKRHCFDADRCGIEKGSVLVVKEVTACPSLSRYVGSYRNEGFGRVIYNPDFLRPLKNADNGEAIYLKEKKKQQEPPMSSISAEEASGSALLQYARRLQQHRKNDDDIYTWVNQFSEEFGGIFRKEDGTFASQWGALREMAMNEQNARKLLILIYNYTNHGVAKEKWDVYKRRGRLIEFLCKVAGYQKKDNGKECDFVLSNDSPKNISLSALVIALASEMAKESSRKENNR